MKIYTKRGDAGETDLFGGERIKKNHQRVKAFGSIDCANAAIGLAYSGKNVGKRLKKELKKIMQLLFCAGAEIATAPREQAHILLEKHLKNQITARHITDMETTIDKFEAELSPLTNFILPCGADTAARLHFARNIIRIAEIALIDLKQQGEEVRNEILIFFNRLSDLIFVLARFANAELGISDITWTGKIDEDMAYSTN
jgi:cob(I)alamin adenosyltransferase